MRSKGGNAWKTRAESWRFNRATRFYRTRAAGSGYDSLTQNFTLYNNGLSTETRGRVCGRARAGYMEYGHEKEITSIFYSIVLP